MMSLMSSTSEDMNHWWFLSCKWSVRWDHFLNYFCWATEFDVRSSFEINICSGSIDKYIWLTIMFSSLICEITLRIGENIKTNIKIEFERCHLLNWRAKGPLWTQPPESHKFALIWCLNFKKKHKNALNIWPFPAWGRGHSIVCLSSNQNTFIINFICIWTLNNKR